MNVRKTGLILATAAAAMFAAGTVSTVAFAVILLVGMPWFLERMASYTRLLLGNFHRFLG